MDINEKFKELHTKIDEAKPDTDERISLISDYLSLCVLSKYLDSSFSPSKQASFLSSNIDYGRYSILTDKDFYNTKRMLEYNSGELFRIAHQILTSFGKKIHSKDNTKINPDEFDNYIKEFLSWLGNDVYKQYQELEDNGYIIYQNSCTNPIEFDMITMPNIILTRRDGYLVDYSDLSHELGHNYSGIIQKPFLNRSFSNYFSEVPSITFEMLFIMFLEEKKYLSDKDLNSIQRDFVTKYLSCVKKTYYIHGLDYLETYVNCDSYDSVIPFDYSYDYLVEDIEDYGPNIKPDKLSFRADFYTIGMIFGSEFCEMILDDRKLGRKYFDEFIKKSIDLKLGSTLRKCSIESLQRRLIDFTKRY